MAGHIPGHGALDSEMEQVADCEYGSTGEFGVHWQLDRCRYVVSGFLVDPYPIYVVGPCCSVHTIYSIN